jgi:hypothetical protein
LPGFIEKISLSQRIQCPAIVVRRSVYEMLGGFRTDLPFAGDWEMWTRVAAHYPVWYEPMTLAAFRVHSRSYTRVLMRSGETIADLRRCIAISHPLLPPDRAEGISRQARELVAAGALEHALACVTGLAFTSAVKHVWQGLMCSRSPRVIKALLSLPARIVRGGMRRAYRAAKRQRARE